VDRLISPAVAGSTGNESPAAPTSPTSFAEAMTCSFAMCRSPWNTSSSLTNTSV
jgi:hypothetical protein